MGTPRPARAPAGRRTRDEDVQDLWSPRDARLHRRARVRAVVHGVHHGADYGEFSVSEGSEVMPVDRSRYPDDWPAIALRTKEAADWICADCGMQCRRPGEPFDTHRRTMSVHHLGVDKSDGTPGDMRDKQDCRPENLLALCSKCHLARDLPGHIANAARTRRLRKIEAGQLEIEL